MARALVTIADRPDLAEPAARRLRDERGRTAGRPHAQTYAWSPRARHGLEQRFVGLEEGIPAGMAGLAAGDADSQPDLLPPIFRPRSFVPDLSPWLGSVFVAPAFRGRDIARVLVTAVESAARQAGFPTRWLLSDGAAAPHAGLGWRDAGTVLDNGHRQPLMRRDLARC